MMVSLLLVLGGRT